MTVSICNKEYLQKKLEPTAVCNQAKIMRLQARQMRIVALLMRAQAQVLLERNRNLAARYQEWFVK